MTFRKLGLLLLLFLGLNILLLGVEYKTVVFPAGRQLWLSHYALAYPGLLRVVFLALIALGAGVSRANRHLNLSLMASSTVIPSILLVPCSILFSESWKLGLVYYTVAEPLLITLLPVLVFWLAVSMTSLTPRRDMGFGIKSPHRLIESPDSFNWKTDTGYINVINPFQGIFIVGGAGSGKTYGLVLGIIEQAVRKGFTGFIYDYKYPDLKEALSYHLLREKNLARELIQLDFVHPLHSNRINPLAPLNLPVPLYAGNYAETILRNLKKEWVVKQDFWADNAISYLKSIIWFLKKNHPDRCTLPHAVCMALGDYSVVLSLLEADRDCRLIVSSLLTAHRENAGAQVAGCVSSLQTPIEKLNDPAIFWVLSGSDSDLELNSPGKPAFLVAGNDPLMCESLGPVISLIATVVMKKLNQKNRLKSIFLLDEAPTLYVPGLKDLPNTGRGNLVSTIYCCQDYSQMDVMYGHDESRALRASLGNQFMGMVNDTATAQQISQFFGKAEKLVENKNRSRSSPAGFLSDASYSRGSSWQVLEKDLVRPEQVLSLPCGNFVGKTTSAYRPFFGGKILAEHLPLQKGVQGKDESNLELVRMNYARIHGEAQEMMDLA